MGYYRYYKKNKRTKPFRSIQKKIYTTKPIQTYWDLKRQDIENEDHLDPISEEAFSTILKAALDYAKYSKN